ncbi:hypothetical protein C0992_010304, partial [Termitomyces sp. T32_za158]
VPPTILLTKPGLPSPPGLPGDSLSPFTCDSLMETLPPQETSLTLFTYPSPLPMDNSRNSGYSSLSSTPLPRSSSDSPGSKVWIPGSTGRASPSTSIQTLCHPAPPSHLNYPPPCQPHEIPEPPVKNLQHTPRYVLALDNRSSSTPDWATLRKSYLLSLTAEPLKHSSAINSPFRTKTLTNPWNSSSLTDTLLPLGPSQNPIPVP